MAFTLADWSITRSTLVIDYIGDAHAGTSPSYATGIEFHREVQNLSDDSLDSGDDQIAIIDETPTDRAGADTNIVMLNGYTITATGLEHIYDCSITSGGGTDIWDGIQVFGNSSVVNIVQDGALLTNEFWNEAKMITATSDAPSNTSHRFLIKTRDAGADIDGRRLLGQQRQLSTVYTEFFIGGGTNRGNNTLALTANPNGNNQTAAGTIATWTDIVNDNEGYVGIDADGNTVNEFYYSDWELGAQSKNNFYERAQWIQRDGSSETIYGLNGELFRGITHSVAISGGAGTWVEPESLSWGTGPTAGTGQLLAVDNTAGASSTILYMQLLSGVVPNANTITGNGGATATAGTVTSQLVSLPFVGTSTGSAINPGAFGLGIGADDLTQNDLVVDLTGTQNQPPNNVTFTVTNLVSGDRVLVGNEDGGGGLNLTFDTVVGPINGAAVTSIVCTTAIPTDTPSSGTIRLQNDEGRYVRIPYSSYSGSTYTIPSYDFSGTGINDSVANLNNYFISYIDLATITTSESFTGVYNVDRTVFVRVRNSTAQIKTFETTGTLGSGGGSSVTSRISDA
jgi:hypothetical protein